MTSMLKPSEPASSLIPGRVSGMLEIFESAALAAGKAIVEIRQAGAVTHYKADRSPVTEADEEAERIILAALAQNFPEIPVIAEEQVAAGHVPDITGRSFLLVDPLDGTKEFVSGKDDFTVNIALIEDGVPTAGIVYAPALGVAYAGAGSQAWKIKVGADFTPESREPIRCRAMRQPPVALASRSHRTAETDAFLERCGAMETKSIGSSLKFCLLAEGGADIYPRFGRTMEWDTAAGDAVLRASGGHTRDTNGLPLRYGKTNQSDDADFANPHFIAEGPAPDPVVRQEIR
ncbi:3'(2'),5'-bisphosphate nucleotidase [Neorhizobium alkalisoli]|uniref:3'(2'),5'-bisphosphate nucleotidase CysQ n=2 Tax=Neorhizobium alkalisoli TaxID=528178 RepID=A0A561R1R8_9HYPH|nr:3'(2'),5'-bisphosphate nucleotidase [Neorhizobium alkalisoli]